MSELVGGFGEAVDEKNGAFGVGDWGRGGGVEESDFGVGGVEPVLAVLEVRGGRVGHCCWSGG